MTNIGPRFEVVTRADLGAAGDLGIVKISHKDTKRAVQEGEGHS